MEGEEWTHPQFHRRRGWSLCSWRGAHAMGRMEGQKVMEMQNKRKVKWWEIRLFTIRTWDPLCILLKVDIKLLIIFNADSWVLTNFAPLLFYTQPLFFREYKTVLPTHTYPSWSKYSQFSSYNRVVAASTKDKGKCRDTHCCESPRGYHHNKKLCFLGYRRPSKPKWRLPWLMLM